MPLERSPRLAFPATGLAAEHVLLAAFTEADITDEYVGWLNDPAVVRYSNQRFRRHDAQTCRTYLGSFAGTDNLFLSVRELAGSRTVGTMTAYVSAPHETADVGILIGNRSVWGRGVGQEAWDRLLDWLLHEAGIRKVTAGAVADNLGMVRLMERSGMHHEATRRRQEIVENRPRDLVYYARFRDV